jgi:membrane protease subunit HflC
MKLLTLLLTLGAAAILLFASAFTVGEHEQVFLTQFGKPVGEAINADPAKNEAGLHFKAPFIQRVNRLEKRALEWDGPVTEMATRDKLYVTVDNFARWRISDPLTYYEKLRDERSALSRLDDIIGSETRKVVASHDLIELVRSDRARQPARDETLVAADARLGVLPPIRHGRGELTAQILRAAQPKVRAWGIELLDVRFKRINYKGDVIDKIYSRMISERRQIAERFRSEGAGEAAKIIGRKERDLLEIESSAYRREQEIKGKADAAATAIYAAAYSASPGAADFYRFIKTLDTYRETLGKDTTVILTSGSDLFELFKRVTTPEPAAGN